MRDELSAPWLRARAALAALSSVAAAALAGCGAGSSSPGAAPAAAPGAVAQHRAAAFTAPELRAALLTRVDGAGPVVPVQAGPYGSLRGVHAMNAGMRGVRIIPARCARAAGTGLDSAALASVPATVASFRHGSAGVSEILLASSGGLAAKAVDQVVPRDCAHYRAVVQGRAYDYTVRGERAPHIGAKTRELNVHASGAATMDVWTLIYRVGGYVAAITLVGATATRKDLESIARRAYKQAHRALR